MEHTKHQWGYEMTLVDSKKYAGKMIIVHEGERTPYLYHKRRDITLFVLQGGIILYIEGRKKVLNTQEQYHIRPKIMYRIVAFRDDATILEMGSKLEDDIVVVEE